MKHELVQLAGKIDWEWIDSEIAPLYSDKGRPGIETRFVIGLCCSSTSTACPTKGCAGAGSMTRISNTSRESSSSSMSFRTSARTSATGASGWAKSWSCCSPRSLRVAHASGALRTEDLARVTVDTTVQPKAITFPTDAKLLYAAIKGLSRLAQESVLK